MHATISAIEYHLPEQVLSTAQLAAQYPEWPVAKIDAKTGIRERHIASVEDCSSDLAVAAAQKLFASGAARPTDIDYVLFCTQSPDYFLPTTACLIQERLGIPTSAGALDFNLGCSGYVYGLGLAEGLIATGQARNILLLTAETYSKFLHPCDRGVRTIFGDAGAATLLAATAAPKPFLGPFVYGTNGKGAPHLIVSTGAMRRPRHLAAAVPSADKSSDCPSPDHLFMDGAEIFNFTLSAVPESVAALLQKADIDFDRIDLFVFHQANKYMLEHLRQRLKIPAEKFPISMAHCGNTVSSTLPIALKHASAEGRLQSGALVMLVGFGVGYSWGATLLRC